MYGVVSWRRWRQWAWGLGLAALALALGVSWLHDGTAVRAAPPGAIYRVTTQESAIALAVNVVWGTEYVPQIARILLQHHARATFFLGGAWAAEHPELVRQLAADGMELGNHGYAHRHQSLLSFDDNLQEISAASRSIEAAGGGRPTLYAPPYGEYNETVLRAADGLHMRLIMWTIDTIDWRPSSSASIIVGRVVARASAGAIVLMHPTERTVEALPAILRALTARSYHIVTVSHLLTLGTPTGE